MARPCSAAHRAAPGCAVRLRDVAREGCPWVEDVSERMQCPSDYVGVTGMAALGSLIPPPNERYYRKPKLQSAWQHEA